VLGNVFNQGSLRFIPGQRVGDYIAAAGGHTREADKAHDFVLRADGTVLSRERAHRFDKLLLYPGDSVVIPGKFKPGFNLYDAINIAQLGSSLALAAAAVSVLR
jgi:polysaccharide export outer membrane protein